MSGRVNRSHEIINVLWGYLKEGNGQWKEWVQNFLQVWNRSCTVV